MQIGCNLRMASFETITRKPEARAPLRSRASASVQSLIDRIAFLYIPIASVLYVGDLLRQTRDRLTDGAGRAFGDDLINFWSGPYLAWHGRAAEIYDLSAFHAFQQSIVGEHIHVYEYSYPPMLLVLTLPLAFIPYIPALAVWLVGGWFAFYRALRMALPQGRTWLYALATPAVFVNAMAGQNGTWTAALFGAGLGLLDRRPILAGGLLGLLIYKPQCGILIPIALVAGGRWRTLLAAAATAGGLTAIAAIWLGPEIFSGFLRQAALVREFFLEDGTGIWHRSVSVFVAARRLGADVPVAYVVQAVTAAVAALVVAAVWFGSASFGIRNAILLLGSCLAIPYLQDYDLVFGALIVAWLAQDEHIGQAGKIPLLLASAALIAIPLLSAPLARLTGLELAPLFILPLFVITAKCGLSEALCQRAAQPRV
jgi:arabinofuranan 3-O-arabinosyltransferase